MLRIIKTILILLNSFLPFVSIAQSQITKKQSKHESSLYDQIKLMDKIFFDAYNNCDLETQDSIYSEDIEFFHDKNGLINSKKELLESTKNYICGKVTRILISGSIEVYPLNNYGAVEIGLHRFYNRQEPDAESKPSKFVIIWKKTEKTWKITKVISLHE